MNQVDLHILYPKESLGNGNESGDFIPLYRPQAHFKIGAGMKIHFISPCVLVGLGDHPFAVWKVFQIPMPDSSVICLGQGQVTVGFTEKNCPYTVIVVPGGPSRVREYSPSQK